MLQVVVAVQKYKPWTVLCCVYELAENTWIQPVVSQPSEHGSVKSCVEQICNIEYKLNGLWFQEFQINM